MKTAMCVHCEGTATVTRKDHTLNELGIPVILQNVEVVSCQTCCTEEPIIPNMDGLMLALATAVVCNPRKLTGEEVRFLRKYAGKSATDFARFLHVDLTHLSKIENNKTEIGKRLDKLVRLLVANMNAELRQSIAELIEMIPDIDDSSHDEVHGLHLDPETMSCHYALC